MKSEKSHFKEIQKLAKSSKHAKASITLTSQNKALKIKETQLLDNIRSTKLSRMQSVQKSKKQLSNSKMAKTTKLSKRINLMQQVETSININLINNAAAVLPSQGRGQT